MARDSEKWVCAQCGYMTSGQFSGEICPGCGLTYWKCGRCGFTFTSKSLPWECPTCGEKCDFKDITCYTPECGNVGNIDPRL